MIRSVMLALTAITLLAAGVHLYGVDTPPPEATSQPDPEAMVAKKVKLVARNIADNFIEDAEMKKRMNTRREFAAFNERLLAEMVEGRVGLEQAREHVMYYCLAHYPEYLHHIQIIEQGRTVRQKLASCLLRLVRNYYTPNAGADNVQEGVAPEVLSSLEAEMELLELEDDSDELAR
jgi:hypothetical protein